MTVCLTGYMGCGKSSVGRELAPLLGLPFTDLDEYIGHKIGCSIPEIFRDGEERFRAIEAEAVRDIVTMARITGEDRVVALGGGTFTIRPIRELLLENTVCVYLKASEKTCLERIQDKDSRPMLLNGGHYSERLGLYELAQYTVDTEGLTPRQCAEVVISTINK